MKDWPTTVVVPVLVSAGTATIALLTAAISSSMRRIAESAERRRRGYEDAVHALIAWTEFPYRIRRRTSDLSSCLDSLSNRGHDIQEELVRHRTWIRSENVILADAFDAVLDAVRPKIHRMCHTAWSSSPVTTGKEMNVGSLGPNGFDTVINQFLVLVSTRFWFRRIRFGHRRKLLRQLQLDSRAPLSPTIDPPPT